MIFSSLEFLIFWIFAFFLTRIEKFNTPIIIGAVGLIFYSFQGYINSIILFYVFLIVSFFNYFKKFIFIFIFLILLPLTIIKYSNFIINELLFLNLNLSYLNNFLIPPGLSFISFSAIALILYLKNNHELNSINLSYLYLFPQLIAGPIVEPKSLIPQLKKIEKADIKNIFSGIFIFSIGIFLKVLLADSIGNYIDPIFSNLENSNFEIKIYCMFLFSQQIFFDFNGYTLMALGIGKTLGFNLPENFNAPYLSRSITEFWKKWHITLSSWIKNYVYFPLGGSKNGNKKTYINILLAMLISGFWHGAGFNFLIWGFFHGILIILERSLNLNSKYNFDFIKIFYTYIIVSFLWLFFRLENISEFLFFFTNFSINFFFQIEFILFMITMFSLNYFQKYLTMINLLKIFKKLNLIFVVSLSLSVIFLCIIISKGSSQKFIYFNF